jgi:RNA polymerase sigma factor (sigma-70 family)
MMMNSAPLDDLLNKLCDGDDAAAARVFTEYEPYLRTVVRRLLPERLRPKLDSVDIVQSVWGDLVEGFRAAGWRFANAHQLRAFLVKVTRNRLVDRLRVQDRVLAHEQPLGNDFLDGIAGAAHATPSKHVQADDLWRQMLELCPPEHQRILWLKRQGASMDEICRETGLHPGSVRRILRNLAGELGRRSLAAAR